MQKLLKTSVFVLFAVLIKTGMAQSPQSFKYQTVVRDLSGNALINQHVSFRISILSGSENGPVVYSEIHNDSTNQFGLVTFDIGQGIAEVGIFSEIQWGTKEYFLGLEMDPAGGNVYQYMGTLQMLSVPYSLHTKTTEGFWAFSQADRDTMTTMPIGMTFFNTTSKKINYYEGSHWYEVNGTCLPQPSQPNAGPDQLNISGVTAMLSANSPSSGTGVWRIVSGTDGFLADSLNPSTIFSGTSGNTYTLSWRISNDCGYLADNVIISFLPFSCGLAFKDIRDNNVYNTVQIGSQCWMKENMNIGQRIDGGVSMTNNGVFEKYCQGNLESNCDVYGGLYVWTEAMQYSTVAGVQGICPAGWHIATDAEWKILEGTIDSQYGVGDPVWDLLDDRGYDAGGKLKEAGTVHWNWPNTGATNSSGFTALPGGARNTDGTFPSFLVSGRFWTSQEDGSNAFRRVLSNTRMDIARNSANKNFGLSVRCLKN